MMKKRMLLLGLVLCILLTTGCQLQSSESSEYENRVYYICRGGEGELPWRIVYETRNFGDIDSKEECALVAEALRNPTKAGCRSPLPQDVSIESVTIASNIAFVALSEGYGAMEEYVRSLAVACISLSLLQVDGVEYVSIVGDNSNTSPLYDEYYTLDNVLVDHGVFS